jgi:endonuclease/exonuclease/phosphatase (EEP) superfamily protein YafD
VFRLRIRLAGLIEAACALVIAGTIAGFFGSWAWPLALFDHFRLHYALGALVLTGLALWASRHRWAVAVAVVGALNFALTPAVFSLPGGWGEDEAGEGHELVLSTINVLTANRAYPEVVALVRETGPDVLLLVETSHDWILGLADLLDDYRLVIAHPRGDNFGMALYVRHGRAATAELWYPGAAGLPAIEAAVTLDDGGTLRVYGLHPPPPGRSDYAEENDRVLREAAARIAARPPGPAVALGDFNTTPWAVDFRRFERDSGLADSARGHGYLATWPTLAAPVLRIPLDHVLVSPDLSVTRRWLGPSIGSDHLPLFVAVRMP